MELCKYRREEYDYSDIKFRTLNDPIKYPKKLNVKEGHSTCYQLSQEWFFKRKQQDGNYYLTNNIHSQHHFIYNEEVGSFDDLAEVLCYVLAKNMGTRTKYDRNGNPTEVPVVDVTEYRLAEYTAEGDELQRGCVSRNIVKPNETIIKGNAILGYLSEDPNSLTEPDNSLKNYIAALKKYAEISGVELDNNIVKDLIINSFFCWKVANSDNHSNNIVFIQERTPEGSKLRVGTLIDNGSAWELSIPLYTTKIDGTQESRFKQIYVGLTGDPNITPEQARDVKFERNPFFYHNAFTLDAGDLYGNQKFLNGKNLSYEYDLAAYALSSPEIYDAIFKINNNFDLQRAFDEVDAQYRLVWPEFMKETISATADYKSRLISQAMADYYCYTAYTQCVSTLDQEDIDQTYLTLSAAMRELPLQPSAEDYSKHFLALAKENGIDIDQQQLAEISFLPKRPQSQDQYNGQTTSTQTQEGGQ